MRAAVLVILFAILAADARAASLPWTHTRPMSPDARELLLFATERSSLVRAMVDQLEQTDVAVLLLFSNQPGQERAPDFMTFVTDAGGTRFVAICMRWRWMARLDYVPRLAHELQHALEFADATDVRDRESFVRLFQTIGWTVGDHQYETDLARQTERLVRQELSGGRFEAKASNNPLSKRYRRPM